MRFMSRLSTEFHKLRELNKKPGITMGELFDALNVRGHALVCLFFASPFMLPIPLPGVSQVISPIIGISAFRLAMNWHPWLPEKIRTKAVPKDTVEKVFSSAEKWLKKIEKFIKPRMLFFCDHAWTRRLNGAAIVLCAGLLALPYPPGTNAPPAIAIFLMSLGILEQDGVLIVLGYVGVVANIVLFSLITFAGYEAVMALFQRFFGV